ncbi:MAG: hypothetical protein WA952_09440 [Lewinella sp.]
MAPENLDIDNLTPEQKLQVLENLLNDLHREGILSSHSLMAIASDVMYLDYRDDEDLLMFSNFNPENEDE